MANIITTIRIIISFLILFCTAFSPTFYTLYPVAGISDVIDGKIARKTNTKSEFGSKLDTIADFVFVMVCLIKLLPTIDISFGMYIWIFVIATIKVFNIVLGYMKRKMIIVVHSFMNKLTGGLVFIFPLILRFIDLNTGTAVICTIASMAGIQEGHYILSARPTGKNCSV